MGTSFNDLCLLQTKNNAANSSVTGARRESNPLQQERVFICYHRKDERYLNELRTQLAYYVRAGTVDYWDDTKILPGSKWREEIQSAIQRAKVAVLLISSDFFASDFIASYELPLLLRAAEQQKLLIYSVILRPCLFNETELARFQPVNDPSVPLSELEPGKREEMWVRVANLIKNSL